MPWTQDEVVVAIGLTLFVGYVAAFVIGVIATALWYINGGRYRNVAKWMYRIMASMPIILFIAAYVVCIGWGLLGTNWKDLGQVILQLIIIGLTAYYINGWWRRRATSLRSHNVEEPDRYAGDDKEKRS